MGARSPGQGKQPGKRDEGGGQGHGLHTSQCTEGVLPGGRLLPVGISQPWKWRSLHEAHISSLSKMINTENTTHGVYTAPSPLAPRTGSRQAAGTHWGCSFLGGSGHVGKKREGIQHLLRELTPPGAYPQTCSRSSQLPCGVATKIVATLNIGKLWPGELKRPALVDMSREIWEGVSVIRRSEHRPQWTSAELDLAS